MPRTIQFQNPYRTGSPMGEALGNLAAAYFSSRSTPAEQEAATMQRELAQAQLDEARASAVQATGEAKRDAIGFDAPSRIADVLRTAYETGSDPNLALINALGVSQGYGDAGDLGSFAQAVGGIADVTPERMDMLQRGAGQNPFNVERGANYRNMTPEQRALDEIGQPYYGPTASQTEGRIAASLSPEDQRTFALGAQAFGPSRSQVQGSLLSGNWDNLDLLNENQRQAIGANPSRGRPGISVTTNPDGTTTFNYGYDNLDPTTNRQMGDARQAIDEYRALSGAVRQIAAQDDTLFGATGNARRLYQNIRGQAEAIGNMVGVDLGGDLDSAFAQVAAQAHADPHMAEAVASGYFDPNLTEIDRLATLLAYTAAAALAGQTGRGLSDKDFNAFRRIVGNPSDMFATQGSFLAGLDSLDRIVDARVQIANERQGVATPPPGQTGAPANVPVYDLNGNLISGQ